MTDFSVRKAVLADAESISEIHNLYIQNSTASFDLLSQTVADKTAWLQKHFDSDLPVLILQASDGLVLGYAALSFFQGGCSFRHTVESTIYLRQGYSGKGFGKQLMKSLMTAAQDCGHHAIVALVCAENDAGIALAKSCGFNQCGLLKELAFKFDRWLDLIILQKVL